MILTGDLIERSVSSGKITIDPFSRDHITTNSYDVTLGHTFIRYVDALIDVAVKPKTQEIRVSAGEILVMENGDFLLGHTRERIGSRHFVPILHARSGIARLGLFVHVTADLIDLGSVGQLTFQLFATRRVAITPNMRIGQVSFWKPYGRRTFYNGKYQGSLGPQVSKLQQDFEK
ncbi:dCTP deaminase [Rhizobium etli]|uniref:dCTP deaminase n=1 Tax=Rhizobium etli TaxID=29449 RepID=UPI0003839AAB|nr:dCTP deaminase [Rhizobium etli]AGS25231.1 deoxycytidine triphosphate deaminase [Rhizobium etli bv. mimosae str. Mim1]